jgi:hypothetical protein
MAESLEDDGNLLKLSKPKRDFCTCLRVTDWSTHKETFSPDPTCPVHGKVGGFVSKEGMHVQENEQVIPIESLKEGVPPIELKIHGKTDPELKTAIEKAVKKAMERVSRCTCKPISMEKDELDPNCPIHGEKKDGNA